jgi:hypothetical protein
MLALIKDVVAVNPTKHDDEYILHVSTRNGEGYVGAGLVEPALPIGTVVESSVIASENEDENDRTVTTLLTCNEDQDTIDELDEGTHLRLEEITAADRTAKATVVDGPHEGEHGCIDVGTILVDGYDPASFVSAEGRNE